MCVPGAARYGPCCHDVPALRLPALDQDDEYRDLAASRLGRWSACLPRRSCRDDAQLELPLAVRGGGHVQYFRLPLFGIGEGLV